MGKFEKAFDYQVKYTLLKDSIEGSEIKQHVIDIEKKYELAEKEKEILKNKIIIEQHKTAQSKQLIFIVILIVAIIGTTWWYYIKKKQQVLASKIELNNERTRIAMDLHDHVGAELTLVSAKLDTRIFKSKRETEKEDLQKITNQVRQVSTILRETVWSIIEETISTEQLFSKIEDFANKQLSGSNLKFEGMNETTNTTLNPQVALSIFRISQEAITNSLKYSNASTISLEIKKQKQQLLIRVSDNGKGFDVDNSSTGYGLRNMKKRISEIDGRIIIKSSSKGTIVTLIL